MCSLSNKTNLYGDEIDFFLHLLYKPVKCDCRCTYKYLTQTTK